MYNELVSNCVESKKYVFKLLCITKGDRVDICTSEKNYDKHYIKQLKIYGCTLTNNYSNICYNYERNV